MPYKKANQGKANQKKGSKMEAHVQADLLTEHNVHTLIQQRRSVGGKHGIDKQGCDLVGNDDTGIAVYVEVKAVNEESLSFKNDVKPRQRSFLTARAIEGCRSYVAWVRDLEIKYIEISQAEILMLSRGKFSIRWEDIKFCKGKLS